MCPYTLFIAVVLALLKKKRTKLRILLVNRYHYKREMFCRIMLSGYLVIFIDDINNITMIYQICAMTTVLIAQT